MKDDIQSLQHKAALLLALLENHPGADQLTVCVHSISPDSSSKRPPSITFLFTDELPKIGEIFGAHGWQKSQEGASYDYVKIVDGVELTIREVEPVRPQPVTIQPVSEAAFGSALKDAV